MASNVLAFLPKGVIPVEKEQEEQNEESKSRSVVLPTRLWDITEKDARRCRRSVTKHIEAILAVYYGIESSVNIDEEALKTSSQTSQAPRLKKTA